jgi:hypothetical protein
MRDQHSEAGDNLDALALLYANGEMDAVQAADFERRLGEDQRAREALCLAVELVKTLDGLPTPQPNPAYRSRVRQRLQPCGAGSARPTVSRRYRGHPAAWALLGAAAAFLGVILANGFLTRAPSPDDPVQAAATNPAPEQIGQPALDETALIWSEIPKHERMNRLREEDQRRKTRPDDVRVVRNEERPNRFLTEPPMPSP